MGYKIVYGEDIKISPSSRGNRIRVLTAPFLMAFCLLTGALWPEGRELLRDVLLPGVPTATESAFHNLVNDLRVGEPLDDAVTAFCRRVIVNEVQTAD